MKRLSLQASWFAYLGAILLISAFYPGLDALFDKYPILHSIWHLWLFTGAAALIYGLETLRSLARRHRRMTAS